MTTHDTTCLATVPHTGAHFVVDLLRIVGVRNLLHWHWRVRPRALPQQSKFLITARDPYLTALRYIHNGDSMEDVAKTWKTCISNLYNIDHYIIDMACRKEDRLEHIYNAMRFIDIDPIPYTTELDSFINAWKPVHTTEEMIVRGHGVEGTENNKAIYLETGELPEGYDWSTLDEAFEWYKSLSTNDYV